MQKFASQIISFKNKLNAVEIDSITKDLLVKNYLEKVIEQQDYYLKIYSWVLENALQKSKKPIHQISFLDFGCGNGLFAIFAKHVGVKNVYGCDFNENFISAARLLANAMQINVDDWFVCNEETLVTKCNTLNLDIVAGTDVIEHIYNLNTFFANIHFLNRNMVTAFTTASVFENYLKRKSLYKLMYQDEYIGSNELEATSKDEFVGFPYLEIRKKIIKTEFEQLTEQQVLLLATATKGLKQNDILIYVYDYLKHQQTPLVQSNVNNTCDPITGNFTERILKVKEYKNIYSKNEFQLTVISGFYAAEGKNIKSLIQKVLNMLIFLLRNTSLSRTISPLILLMGSPKSSK